MTLCDCPLFEALLKTCWSEAETCARATLRPYCVLQHKVFKILVQIELEAAKIYYSGEPFSQAMHDGGTLKNRNKYQNLAIKFIQPFDMKIIANILGNALSDRKGQEKLTVAQMFALPDVVQKIYNLRTSPGALKFQPLNISIFFVAQGASGTGQAVGEAMTKKFKEVTKINISKIVSSSISDAAALLCSSHLGTDGEEDDEGETEDGVEDTQAEDTQAQAEETQAQAEVQAMIVRLCDMHNLAKVVDWSIGNKKKSRKKKVGEFILVLSSLFSSILL
jgi:hypothetical protein